MGAGYGRLGLQAGLVGMGMVLVLGAPAAAAETPTFSKDVAPILQAKCQECHQPNSIAPMSLVTYRRGPAVGALHPRARESRGRCRRGTSTRRVGVQQVQERHVADATSRSTRSSAGWMPGAPQGDPKDMPPPSRGHQATNGRRRRTASAQPDLVIKSSEYTMPAQASGRRGGGR